MTGASGSQVRRIAPRSFIFVTVFVDMLGYGIVIPLLPPYVGRQASGGTLVGVLGSLYALAQSIGGPALSGLSDYYGRRPVLLACLLGTAMAYILLGLADSLWLLTAAILLDGLTGGNISTAQAYIADSAAPEERAQGFATPERHLGWVGQPTNCDQRGIGLRAADRRPGLRPCWRRRAIRSGKPDRAGGAVDRHSRGWARVKLAGLQIAAAQSGGPKVAIAGALRSARPRARPPARRRSAGPAWPRAA
ncbi:MAG TPA: MFS transporter [Roseiflexaceae bacterium]|nr:MFS transporter [Roseiflexaceae bacterium]